MTGTCIGCRATVELTDAKSRMSDADKRVFVAAARAEDVVNQVTVKHKVGGRQCKGGGRVPVETWQECVAAATVGHGSVAGAKWLDEWALVHASAHDDWSAVQGAWLGVKELKDNLTPTPLVRAAIAAEKSGTKVVWLEDLAKYIVENGLDRGVIEEFRAHRGYSEAQWARIRVESIRARKEYVLLKSFVDAARADESMGELLRLVYSELGVIRQAAKSGNKRKRQEEALEQVIEDVRHG